jgi:hypothetical protein
MKKNLGEHKGVDPVKITNCTHIIFLTNNDNAIKIESDDRRFAAVECYNERANNKVYFERLVNEITSKNLICAFITY